MKRLSKEPWFAKKTSWGMRPITRSGWLSCLIFVVVLVGLLILTYYNPQNVLLFEILVVLTVIGFILTTALTSDRDSKE